ncbi:MAG TPA: CHRD domain-containing protein, partial [Chitinophagaceae bacterium]|nr:CHRD domain-containing protein [Chitinophagaceae bacterium]
MFQKKNYLLLFLLILVTFGCDSDDDTNFTANLIGSSEVPPVTTSATGSANFTLDEDNDTIQFTL